ncbi:serine/threonine-protein kinase [Streptomyces sp. VRA16 Mangrove soil]|uniref:serine/threonine-protein kinase n=1 Tax=Streptomyces sp. VRA16 Mangrove soil TaxID=2817434 RepID=UPI001A9F560E|nr:serine/threonine-protein kinase [Streptomyces sp. VRA16 Mangrove soil]MBO1335103.1 serine/threonine protein kinase [Streptomyces sp. VRA16 Mangrove soil]
MGTEGGSVRVIGGRYRLEARIGRGGMGVVWRAADTLLGRQVAVKEIAIDESLSEDDARQQRERMLREARAVAQLRHPNIIVVHDVVLHDEHPYIVMELVTGGSLAARIAREGPVDATEAARIGLALLGALRVAHAAGVLHRDLKPANVLMEAGTGRVVLTDFGIAQVAGATTLTETGGFVGSPEYTAPERMAGERAGAGADLWSLGALLIATLTGESPFRRDSLGGILHAVVYEEIRPPAAAEPLLPVIQGLLQREPDRRMGLDEAERLLRAYVATGATPQPSTPYGAAAPRTPRPSSTPYTPTRRDAPEPGRGRGLSTRVLLIAAALVAAVAGAGIAVAVVLSQQDGGGDNAPPGTVSPSPTRSSATPTPTVTVTRQETRTETPRASAPAGYRVVDDPKGFRIAVPEGYTRELDGPRIFYMSPGRTFRIGIKVEDTESGGPGAVQRRSDAAGPKNNPGYRDGKVTDTTHDGHTAALWEFSWNGFSTAEGARHTVDLCWEQGGRMYDVWVSAPVGQAGQGRAHFDAAVDTFAPSARD